MTLVRAIRVAGTLFLGAGPMVAQVPTLRLEHTLGLDGTLSFGALADGAVAADGGVVLADGANMRIYRFTAAGRLRDSLGAKGDGPGEMRLPIHVVVMPDGQVVVGDVGRRALVRWDAEGRRLGEVRVAPWMLDLYAVGNDLVIESQDWRSDTIHVYRFPAGAPVPDTPQRRILLPPDRALGQRLGVPGSAFLVAANHRAFVAVADTFYRITEISGSGSPLRSWSRANYPVVRWTDAERARIRNNAARLRANSGKEVSSNDADFQTKFTIPLGGLALDGQGRLWVMPQVTGDSPRHADVFAEDGRLLASHVLAGRPDHFAVRGDRLLTWGETEDGEPAAWVYRIK